MNSVPTVAAITVSVLCSANAQNGGGNAPTSQIMMRGVAGSRRKLPS
jgi:hypothetical protein